MSDIPDETDKWVTRHLLERPAAPSGFLTRFGRCVIFGSRPMNCYFNEAFINSIFTRHIGSAIPEAGGVIADFASGYGHVGYTVAQQASRQKNCLVLPVGVDNFREDYWLEEKPKPCITTAQANLKNIPFEKNSFHAGILRFALPFIPKDDQPKVLEQIHRVLKPGAVLVVLNDGVSTDAETNRAWSALFAESARSEGLADMHYPSCESLIKMAREAKFEVTHREDLTETAIGYLTPQNSARFINPKLDWWSKKAVRAKLKLMFQEWKEKDPSSFEPRAFSPKSLRVPWPMYSLVLKKPLLP